MWEDLVFAALALGMGGLFVVPLVRRPDRRAARLDGGEHLTMFTVKSATAPAWAYMGGLGGRVDLYDEVIIVTSTAPRGWAMRRSEIRELRRERVGVVSVFGTGTTLVRAYDDAWLGTSEEQHALLERWLAGGLRDSLLAES